MSNQQNLENPSENGNEHANAVPAGKHSSTMNVINKLNGESVVSSDQQVAIDALNNGKEIKNKNK